jgi:hypothetical protein
MSTAEKMTTRLAAVGLAVLSTAAFARIHVRAQTTLVGYELGQLKTSEGRLLEERANLKMQLAKLTTRKHLQLMTDVGERADAPTHTVAQK